MDELPYKVRLRSLVQQLDECFKAARSEQDLRDFQAVLMHWFSNALAKEISLGVVRMARGIRDRALLSSPAQGGQP